MSTLVLSIIDDQVSDLFDVEVEEIEINNI